MEPIISPWLIYLAGIVNPLKFALGLIAFIGFIACFVLGCFYYIEGPCDGCREEHNRKAEIKQAEAEAKKKVAVAEGDAQAKRIQADAEAYYNAQVASSLTPEMVQLKQVEKWDGKLPTYSGITNGLLNLK